MLSLPFAPWEPDKAALNGGHAPEASGVIPSASGYVPFPSFQKEPGLAALPGPFRGAAGVMDTAEHPWTIAGTDTGLYWLKAKSWSKIGGDYRTGNNSWDFARYGNTLIAVNGVDAPQYATISADALSVFKPIEGAPVGSSVEVVREFVMIGGVGPNRTKIRWSALGDPLSWPAPGSNEAQYSQSDEQDFPDTGSAVAVSGALSGLDLLVFTERAIYRGQYTGSPYIFQFDIVDKGRGAIAPRSVVTGENAVYFLSENGFYATDGGSLKNIGFERVNAWFRKTADEGRRFEVRGAADPVSGIIFWTFATDNAPPGVHDHILVHHPQLDQWSHAENIATVGLFPGLTRPTTLEQLNAVAVLDELPYSLDSRVWKGGVPALAGVSPDNRLGWFAGTPVAATIDTAESGGKRILIHGIRPLVDGAKASASVLCRDFPHEKPMERVCAPVSAMNGIAHTHLSTRYARARVDIPAGAHWNFAVSCEMVVEEEGAV